MDAKIGDQVQIGTRYKRLVVAERTKHNNASVWRCVCDCGGWSFWKGQKITRGTPGSCGCLKNDLTRAAMVARTKHGHAGARTPTYVTWKSMMRRCRNPNVPDFPRYGGRGISVCDRWHEYTNFLLDMGERPAGTSIDRIDNNGNYEPGNCRWATVMEQRHNQRPRADKWAGVRRTQINWLVESGLPERDAKELLGLCGHRQRPKTTQVYHGDVLARLADEESKP